MQRFYALYSTTTEGQDDWYISDVYSDEPLVSGLTQSQAAVIVTKLNELNGRQHASS